MESLLHALVGDVSPSVLVFVVSVFAFVFFIFFLIIVLGFVVPIIQKTKEFRSRKDRFFGHDPKVYENWGSKRSSNEVIKRRLYRKQSGCCKGCKVKLPERNFELDHIVPRAIGAPDVDDNLQLLCGACNRAKGKRPMVYLMEKLRKERVI